MKANITIQCTDSHYMYIYHMKSLGTWLCVAMHKMSYIKIYVPSGEYYFFCGYFLRIGPNMQTFVSANIIIVISTIAAEY